VPEFLFVSKEGVLTEKFVEIKTGASVLEKKGGKRSAVTTVPPHQRKMLEKFMREIKIVLILWMKENVIRILCVFILIEGEGENQVAALKEA